MDDVHTVQHVANSNTVVQTPLIADDLTVANHKLVHGGSVASIE